MVSAPPVVLTLGETMALLDVQADGTPSYGSGLTLRVAGAETNFAIGLQRLGVPCRWISRVGDDVLGQVVVEAARSEGIDVTRVARDPGRSTGIFMKWRRGAETDRAYFRRHSAASALSPADIPPADDLDDVAWVHVTGITLALSPSSAAAVLAIAERACRRGIPVSFDLNYRPSLWPDARTAAAAAGRLLPYARWVLCGAEEAAALFGADDPASLGSVLRASGAYAGVMRTGTDGAWLVGQDEQLVPIPEIVDVVDEIGAGDAFAAGFVAGTLAGRPPAEAVQTAHTVAARALAGTGDWETLPTAAEIGFSVR